MLVLFSYLLVLFWYYMGLFECLLLICSSTMCARVGVGEWCVCYTCFWLWCLSGVCARVGVGEGRGSTLVRGGVE